MPSREPSLRRAHEADAPAIASLTAAAYGDYVELIGRLPMPMSADQAAAVRDHEVWVLEDDGSLAGVLEVVREPDHLWIENVAIRPDHQGLGYGRRLLDFAETLAADGGYAEIRLHTNERYARNLAMYAGRGYRETGRVPYRGTDLVTLAKPI